MSEDSIDPLCKWNVGDVFVFDDVVSVTSDKLLLTMLTGKPQLQGTNPDIMQAASPQDQPPSCLQIFGLEQEQDLTLGNPLRLDESKLPTSTLPMLKVPVNSTNKRTGLAIDPKIT
ncbi:hypothetical protein DSO57_1011049 [Entomophthora muscae]|uniref:Uncharacterized protein n=1 Tax=Entomophthora muscae TaxID=34485 RepID=A0ACC2RXF1_9FUNG|nr:hypothetical protein DSO57_1011049 [Entomophthora muscae]